MSSTPQYVYRDGQRLTPAMLHDLEAMDAEFFARTGEHLVINEGGGIRLDAEQEAIFRDRYRRSAWSPFGDYRKWDGSIWGRVKGATTAAPGLSNHQIDVAAGRYGALDLSDTGSDAGILTRGSFRARVFDEIAGKYGFDSEGYGFGENWHKRYNRNPWRIVAALPATVGRPVTVEDDQDEEEDDMYTEEDRKRDVETHDRVTVLWNAQRDADRFGRKGSVVARQEKRLAELADAAKKTLDRVTALYNAIRDADKFGRKGTVTARIDAFLDREKKR